MKRNLPKIPDAVYARIKTAAQNIASEMGYLNASNSVRSTIINALVDNTDVGKRLSDYLDKTRVRSHIKDNILRAMSQQQFFNYPIDEQVEWCKSRYGAERLIVVERECSNPRRSVYWLKDEMTGFSVFVAECAYRCWESALRAALLFIAKNKVTTEGGFKILLSLSPGQAMVSEREEQFLREALAAIDVDIRIVRKSSRAVRMMREDSPRLYAEGEFPAEERFARFLPVYGFRAACGKFGAGEEVVCDGWMDVTDAGLVRLGRNEGLFVVRAMGHSMEPRIRDGQYCVFECCGGAFHDGEIVLAQHAPVVDDETEVAFSVKRVERRGDAIVLCPLSPAYEPIPLPADFGADDYRVVGTLRKTL